MKVIKLFICTISFAFFLMSGCCEKNINRKEVAQIESSDIDDQVQSQTKAEQLISNQKPRFKVIRSTITEFQDKELIVYGYCTLHDYFNGLGYREANITHYCVAVENNDFERIYAYFEKNENEKLLQILSESDRVPMKLKISCLSSKFQMEAGPQFEGLSWQLIK